MTDPDKHLLERTATGDEAALASLIETHKEKLFRFAYRYVRNESDAEEIVAETFVRVHRYATGFKPRAKVLTWIFSIATNLCHDHHRKSKRGKWVSIFSNRGDHDDANGLSPVDRLASDAPSAAAALESTDEYDRLLQLIETLPVKLKAPFLLHVLEDHSQSSCAEILGVSEKTIETRIYRARKRLRAALAIR